MNVTSPTPSPRLDNTAAVMVTYHPDSDVLDRIARISAQISHLLIIDNSHPACTLLDTSLPPGVEILHNHTNFGIATALNQGMNWSLSRGFDWTLTFDQDTVLTAELLPVLARVHASLPDPAKVALIGCNFTDVYGQSQPHFDLAPAGSPYIESRTFITSGSLYSNQAYRICGPFLEILFIDSVDNEYCLRARAAGFRVYITREELICHPVGQRTIHRLLGRRFMTGNHAPFRRYFMARNRVWLLCRHWRNDPLWCAHQGLAGLVDLFKIIAFEQRASIKLSASLAGYRDAIFALPPPSPALILERWK